MYTHQEMLRAVKLYIQLNKRTALTIQTLGYPTKNTLRSWYKTYLQSGDLPQGYIRHKQVFTEQQKAEAIQHYVENGRCMAHTIRCLGYPCKETLRKWCSHPLN
ncbi:IS3 family transposase IS1353 [Oligella sp. MSHR50489EDL]